MSRSEIKTWLLSSRELISPAVVAGGGSSWRRNGRCGRQPLSTQDGCLDELAREWNDGKRG